MSSNWEWIGPPLICPSFTRKTWHHTGLPCRLLQIFLPVKVRQRLELFKQEDEEHSYFPLIFIFYIFLSVYQNIVKLINKPECKICWIV